MKTYVKNVKNPRPSWCNLVYFGCIFVATMLLVLIIKGINNREREDAFTVEGVDSKRDLVVPIREIIKGQPIELPQDDPMILQFIRDSGIVRDPSAGPYNLTKPDENPSMGQGQYIRTLFRDKKNGFFVECGALDGETRSNTLTLEKELNWEGLLIEASPSNFDRLLKKNRRAWSVQACLAVKPYPHEVLFLENFNVGKISKEYSKNTVSVQCYPFFTLMSYLNVSSVDYFSLDVEGNELDVLKTIPFSSMLIKTLSVEFLHVAEGTSEIVDFMKSVGYVNVSTIKAPNNLANDVIFVHSSQKDLLENVSPV